MFLKTIKLFFAFLSKFPPLFVTILVIGLGILIALGIKRIFF